MSAKSMIVIMSIAALLALGGCGRKGPLEPPPGMSPEKAAAQDQANKCRDLDNRGPIERNIGGDNSGNPNRLADKLGAPCPVAPLP
jgi:predicted small lipoprotein YifL